MRYTYAQLDTNCICYAVLDLVDEVVADNLVEIPEYSDCYIGRTFIKGKWSKEKSFINE